MASFEEQRQQPRVLVPRVLVKVSTPERMRVAYLRDLSAGGLFIRTERPLAKDRVVEIDLLPPGRASPIRLRGRVVRVQADAAARAKGEHGMAVQFSQVAPEVQAELAALLAEYESAPPPTAGLAPAEAQQLRSAVEAAELFKRELVTEREQRLAAEERLLKLSAEREQGAAGDAALHAELSLARDEVAQARALASEAQGNAEAYREELAILELDGAESRALAQALGEDKRALEAELAATRRELAEQRSAFEAELAATRRELAEQRSSFEAELAATRGELAEQKSAFEAELAFAQQALLDREGTLEADAQAQVEHLARLESERSQRAAVQARLEDAVTLRTHLQARVRELEGILSKAQSHIMAFADVEEARAAAQEQLSAAQRALEAERKESERLRSRERELLAGGGASARPSPSAALFSYVGRAEPGVDDGRLLARLKGNARLLHRPPLDDYQPLNGPEQKVVGILQGGDRYEALKVLARGDLTAEQLDAVLLSFLARGLIAFED